MASAYCRRCQNLNVHNFIIQQYPLYVGELEEQRKYSRGTVTLRLRLEFPDMRAALIRGMLPPPQTTVSVARSVDYEVAHYTTDGLVDEDKFSLNTLTRYIEEVQTLSDVMLQQMRKAAMSVSFLFLTNA